MLRRLTLPLFLLMPLVWLFRRALFAGEVLAFRDVGHFYYPLYQYVQRQWREGIPLWNPLDGLGQPLLGDPTAAVLYPGKLIFTLPTSFGFCITLYAIAHLLLAGYGSYFFARELRANRNGAILAGISYELSGQVLFQYCNLIYLVGAAWLPWALLFVYRIGVCKSIRQSTVGLSVTLCLMVLGGEPQMAIHIVLCSLVWASIVFTSRIRKRELPCRTELPIRFLAWIGIACFLALGLTAVQILPSKEWSNLSDRALRNSARSCSELLVDYVRHREFDTAGFWNRETLASAHAGKTYDFSVGPWRWSELFWPNISGHFGPVSTRWIRALPGEGRMWTASLYLGLLPICLAIFRWRLFSGSRRVRWISWLTLLSILAAMGEYGVGWVLDEFRFQVTGEQFERSPIIKGFGGLYWFLTISIPSYADFRYPAKWWTVASLSISVLAAMGWPLLWSPYRRRLLLRLVVCGALALLAMAVFRFWIVNSIPSSSAFGPFDDSLSLQHLSVTILHVVVCGAGFCILLRKKSKLTTLALIFLTTIELTLAQQSLILTATESTQPTNVVHVGTLWREASPMYPPQFRESSSIDRVDEMREHDIKSLMPKYHLLSNVRQLNSISSMHCADFHSICATLDEGPQHSQRTLDFFGVNELHKPPTAWLVFQWKRLPAKELSKLVDYEQQTRDVLLGASKEFIDHRTMGVVETEDKIPPPESEPRNHNVEVVSASAKQIEIHVQTDAPGLLILREQFYPGWNATLSAAGSTQETAIHRTNRVMRGVFVPAGESTVELRYEPRSFYFGAWISIASWLSLSAYLFQDYRYSNSR